MSRAGNRAVRNMFDRYLSPHDETIVRHRPVANNFSIKTILFKSKDLLSLNLTEDAHLSASFSKLVYIQYTS